MINDAGNSTKRLRGGERIGRKGIGFKVCCSVLNMLLFNIRGMLLICILNMTVY